MNAQKILNGINEDFIKKGAAGVNDEDIRKVMGRAKRIKEKILRNPTLKGFFDDVNMLISMIKDFWEGHYQHIPLWVICAIVFALLYVLNPFDLIPDFIPVIGLLDDAAVLGLCLAMVENEIQKYKEWKKSGKQIIEV